ncbi:unnamed protein product [Angiostrongylus costaricensis]|uniref:HMG box domain-containing protein n=1 Tax=Angiostrongylus costaricensis TaxID=334426 RepID=A0A0R3PV13_ANGCS|nr:unnamed protein product [Angiostrongylus costaricensis]
MECGFLLYAEHLCENLSGTSSSSCEFLHEMARTAWRKISTHEKQVPQSPPRKLVCVDRKIFASDLDQQSTGAGTAGSRRQCFDIATNITMKGDYYV